MPDEKLIVTPLTQPADSAHQQAAQKIQGSLQEVLGTPHQVIPTTAESEPEGDSLSQFKDRYFYNRPGTEPSKSWFKRWLGRMRQKNPNSEIQEKRAA